MNIKEAKEEIRRAVEVYLDKNEFGEYTIPVSKQRPIFMVGAPGIGKTAIMEQIASELDIALVSYSMTHHTRQSALGLPVIESKEYDGKSVTVSEYTMSEIIAAIYQVMEASGKKEGILFLDEINCVSETLAPAMLLFLQYKIFGNRQIPRGWVVVTAGNPPQYNKSVKEFDVATMDRLRRIDVTEDFGVWKQYAYHQGVHDAVIAFLELNRQWFYSIQESVDGTRYVTARGWEDLSTAMRIYEKKGFPVDKGLIGQYLADDEIARKFHVYYQLYKKYQSDYQIEDILDGTITDEIFKRAKEARMDERFSILGLLLGRLNDGFRASMSRNRSLLLVVKALRAVKKLDKEKKIAGLADTEYLADLLEDEAQSLRTRLEEQTAANSVTAQIRSEYLLAIQILNEYAQYAGDTKVDRSTKESGKNNKNGSSADGTGKETKVDGFAKIKKRFDKEARQHEKDAKNLAAQLEHAFSFIEKVWGNTQEMVLFVTELTTGMDSLEFIEQWGSESYFRYNQELLTYDQRERLSAEIQELMEE
ncbi:MAG: AAA family ATPase [Lachnospiraceae bacterium]|nr:AAA family ATPase [Lachnospiraceae bacterium]